MKVHFKSPTRILPIRFYASRSKDEGREIREHASRKGHVESDVAAINRLTISSAKQPASSSVYPPGGFSYVTTKDTDKSKTHQALSGLLHRSQSMPVSIYGDARCKNAISLRMAQLVTALGPEETSKENILSALETLRRKNPIKRFDRMHTGIRRLSDFESTGDRTELVNYALTKPNLMGLKLNAFDQDAIDEHPHIGKVLESVAYDAPIVNVGDDAQIYALHPQLVTSLGKAELDNLTSASPEKPGRRVGILMDVVHLMNRNGVNKLTQRIAQEQKPGSLLAVGYNELIHPLFPLLLKKYGYRPVNGTGLDYDYLLERK